MSKIIIKTKKPIKKGKYKSTPTKRKPKKYKIKKGGKYALT